MTSMTSAPLSTLAPSRAHGGSTRARSAVRGGAAAGETSGRRALVFTLMLAAATLLVAVLLLLGPMLPLAATVVLALTAIALVVAGWALAGPRW